MPDFVHERVRRGRKSLIPSSPGRYDVVETPEDVNGQGGGVILLPILTWDDAAAAELKKRNGRAPASPGLSSNSLALSSGSVSLEVRRLA